MAKGFIKLHRGIQTHWLWTKEPFTRGQAWLDMVMLATHEKTSFPHGGQTITLQRGQFLNSIEQLALRWHWGEKKARNFFNLLVEQGMIEKESTRKYTLFAILNYEKWQGEGEKEGRTEAGLRPDRESQKGRTETVDTAATEENQADQRPDRGKSKSPNKADIQEVKNKEIKNKDKDKESKTVKAADPIPYGKLVDLFHSACPSLPKVIKLTDARKQSIAARWKEHGQGMKPFYQLFHAAQASNFLKGENTRQWQANFDWLLKADNMTKTLEGNYNNKRGGKDARDDKRTQQRNQYAGIGIVLDELEL